MAIKVLGHTVLVKPDKVEKKTDWGFDLQINERQEESAQITGTVVSVGDQAWKAFSVDFTGEPWAKVGDHVVFSKFAGRYVTDPYTEEVYMLMNDEDIRAIITEEE